MKRRIGPVGTIARVCTGLVLLAVAVVSEIAATDLLIGLIVMPASVIVILWMRGLNAPPLRLFGFAGYTLNFGLAGLLLSVATVPALLFYGVSMLFAAARGYAGCEIFAIQNWVTGRDDRMACPVFSPIDSAERRYQLASGHPVGPGHSVRVTLQYFESCPNWQVADERLKSVIDQNDLDVDLTYQLIESPEDAATYGFHGSPSILIDGVDPFASADTKVGYACRTYITEAGPAESPSVEQIAAALGV